MTQTITEVVLNTTTCVMRELPQSKWIGKFKEEELFIGKNRHLLTTRIFEVEGYLIAYSFKQDIKRNRTKLKTRFLDTLKKERDKILCKITATESIK